MNLPTDYDIRAQALLAAVEYHSETFGSPDSVIKTAEKFHAFLSGRDSGVYVKFEASNLTATPKPAPARKPVWNFYVYDRPGSGIWYAVDINKKATDRTAVRRGDRYNGWSPVQGDSGNPRTLNELKNKAAYRRVSYATAMQALHPHLRNTL